MRVARAARGVTCAITLTSCAGRSLIFKLFGITIGAFKIGRRVLIGLNALECTGAAQQPARDPRRESEGTAKEDNRILPLGVRCWRGPALSPR